MTFDDIIKNARFGDNGLLPVIVQDSATKTVLMMAYMNHEALEKTVCSGYTHFWSRSRNALWLKGETSGHTQKVISMSLDCDCDTLLVIAEQNIAACHTGTFSCFSNTAAASGDSESAPKVFNPDAVYGNKKINWDKAAVCSNDIVKEPIQAEPVEHAEPAEPAEFSAEDTQSADAEILRKVYEIILDRRANPKEGSYTNYLFDKGLDKILKKVGEETSEVIIASKNNTNDEIVYEVSDLLYHVLVLLAEKGINPGEIFSELEKRHKP